MHHLEDLQLHVFESLCILKIQPIPDTVPVACPPQFVVVWYSREFLFTLSWALVWVTLYRGLNVCTSHYVCTHNNVSQDQLMDLGLN
jgi:hypothetical protein